MKKDEYVIINGQKVKGYIPQEFEVEVWKRAYDQARFANKIKFTKQIRMERIQHLMLGFIYGILLSFFIFIMIFF